MGVWSEVKEFEENVYEWLGLGLLVRFYGMYLWEENKYVKNELRINRLNVGFLKVVKFIIGSVFLVFGGNCFGCIIIIVSVNVFSWMNLMVFKVYLKLIVGSNVFVILVYMRFFIIFLYVVIFMVSGNLCLKYVEMMVIMGVSKYLLLMLM